MHCPRNAGGFRLGNRALDSRYRMSYAGDVQVLQYCYRKTTVILYIRGIIMKLSEHEEKEKTSELQLQGSKQNILQSHYNTGVRPQYMGVSI